MTEEHLARTSLADRTRLDGGVEVRRCHVCEVEQPVADFASLKIGICRACKRERQRRYYAEGRLKIDRAQRKEADRRYRQTDKRRRQTREYAARVKADPARHIPRLEERRIKHRLCAEQAGRDIETIRALPALMGPARTHRRPAKPLVEKLTIVAEARSRTLAEVCELVGISPRTLLRWQKGESPTLDARTADLALVWLSLNPFDVWSDEELAAAADVW